MLGTRSQLPRRLPLELGLPGELLPPILAEAQLTLTVQSTSQPVSVLALGDSLRIAVLFTSFGLPAVPETVSLLIVAPDGTREKPVPVEDGEGSYHHDLVVEKPGRWECRYVGSGRVAAAAEGHFWVANSDLV